jgi:PLD-like domain
MTDDFLIRGPNPAAPFKLAVHRGEGMCLLAMDWKNGEPPEDFVGFSIEYRPPDEAQLSPVFNRLTFPGHEHPPLPGETFSRYPSPEAPFQTFRWVHFPNKADLAGEFHYRVTPVFMNPDDSLRPGEAHEIPIRLARETYPGKLNIAFTRGYVSSQAFVNKFGGEAAFPSLIPRDADAGVNFVPTHPKAQEAYRWMGFEARAQIMDILKAGVADPTAKASIVAFELNIPELIDLLAQFGNRLRIILDDSVTESHDKSDPNSAESIAGQRLAAAGAQVRRQHMSGLQHNKMIVIKGGTVNKVVCGSTNFSWRGFFVQSNNAVILTGADVVEMQLAAFDGYWNDPGGFRRSNPATWQSIPLPGIDAQISMSPHRSPNLVQDQIAQDIVTASSAPESSVFYSLAFLNLIRGPVKAAVTTATNAANCFTYGMSNVNANLVLHQTDGNPAPVSAAALGKNAPEPFKSEASGGSGVRLHHKFVVLNFNKPDARVYTGSYNFSGGADTDNGENLLLIKDRRVATVYMVEALRIFDSYQFRISQAKAKVEGKPKELKFPPRAAGELPWWKPAFTEPVRIRDRKLFSG